MQKQETAMQIHIKDLHKIRQMVKDKKVDVDLEEIITETINGCIENAESHLGREKNQIRKSYTQGAKWGLQTSSEEYFDLEYKN